MTDGETKTGVKLSVLDEAVSRLLMGTLDEIDAGALTATKLVVIDEARFGIHFAAGRVGAPVTVEAAAPRGPACPSCPGTDVRDAGDGEAICMACGKTWRPAAT